MHSDRNISSSAFPPRHGLRADMGALDFVRRQARQLLRDARGERLMDAMPAVRRAHAAGLFGTRPLSAVYRERAQLQLKHFLRTLAHEAGYPSWERYKPVLEHLPAQALGDFFVEGLRAASLNPWFSNEAEARSYAAQHGGRVVRYRHQAVVIPEDGLNRA